MDGRERPYQRGKYEHEEKKEALLLLVSTTNATTHEPFLTLLYGLFMAFNMKESPENRESGNTYFISLCIRVSGRK